MKKTSVVKWFSVLINLFTAKEECVPIATPMEENMTQTSAQEYVRNTGRLWMRAAKKKTQIQLPSPKLESRNAAIIDGVAVSPVAVYACMRSHQ